MAENNLERRSSRRIQGLLPEVVDELVRQRRPRQVVNPPDDSDRSANDEVILEGAGFVAGGEGHQRESNTPSDDDSRSIRSNISTASSLRRRQREADIRAAENLARLEGQREALEAERRRVEREADLVRLRAQMERDNLEEDLLELGLEGANAPMGNAESVERRDGLQGNRTELRMGPSRDVANWVARVGETMASAEERLDEGMASFPEARRAPAGVMKDNEGGRVPVNQLSITRPAAVISQPNEGNKDSIDRLAEVLSKSIVNNRNDNNRYYMARSTVGKVKLPEFHGNPAEWPTFIAQFTSSSEECGFRPVENLIRLQECLKGKAKECVQALLVSPNNLQEILETLEVNFGRKDLIIWHLIDKAKKIATPKEDDFGSVLSFSNAVGNMCATMKTLGSTVHLQNPQLLRDLVEKLPTAMRYDWAKYTAGEDEIYLEEFANWLKRLTRALASTAILSTDFKNRKRENAFHLEESDEKKCQCCGMTNHTTQKCRKFKKLNYDSKQKLVVEKRLCFGCLNVGHRSRDCDDKKKCSVDGCDKYHHQLLHKFKGNKGDSKISQKEEKEEESFLIGGKSAHLAIIPVVVTGPAGEVQTFACLDEGTTSTYIDSTLAKKLGLEGTHDPVTVSMMDGTVKKIKDSHRVTFSIRGQYGQARSNIVKGARTVPDIGIGDQSLDFAELSRKYGYLDGLPVISYKDAKPLLLIGQADKLLTLARKHAHGKYGEPIAYKTWLGWVVSGKFGSNSDENSSLIKEISDDHLHQLVKDSFAIEALGVHVNGDKTRSKEDQRADEIMQRTTRRIGDQFETGLLWESEDIKLPQSFGYAFSRLKGQERKMDKDPSFAKAMCDKMDEYLSKGYIRKLANHEVTQTDRTWYLPYFGVINPNKPGKMRLVFDAAAKCQGASLNSKLLQGPDFLNPLLSVLWKFRQRRIAFGADITDMYHRIKIIENDLPAQRFLWRGMDRGRKPDVYQINVMIFGAACSPSSAMFVKNLNALEFQSEFPEACAAIHENFYMDDYLDSVDSEEEAKQKIAQVIEVHRRGGFVLCKWICNSKVVLGEIPDSLRSDGLKEVDLKQTVLPTGRALGVWWNPENDKFCFKLSLHRVPADVKNGSRYPTKREALTLVMSIFDPLGMVAHVTVKSKILLQDIWRSGIHWDEAIPENLQQRWSIWMEELKTIQSVEVPRCYSLQIPAAVSIQLHVFNDSSAKAYCSVAYLRVEGVEFVDVSFVAAKTRVTPLKEQSMPRLELQAALMGSRLAGSIKENHSIRITDVFMWTDSTTVIHWIKSEDRRFKQFIGHRLGEILELTEVSSWRWIPTKENVADDATRDNGECDVSSSSRWFNGPPFLKENPMPIPFTGGPKVNLEDLEMKKETAHVVIEKDAAFPFKDYSSFYRLIRNICWVLRWKSHNRGCLKVEEMKNAELHMVKIAQKESFFEELKCLQEGKPVTRKSRIFKLSPFLDNVGVIRMKGRLVNADCLPYDTKFPIILDSHHHFSSLIIGRYHEQCGHHSNSTVINTIREKYWITAIGPAVRSVVFRCQFCKNKRVTPAVPAMGDLPTVRVTPYVRPFTYTGMDVFGPFEVTMKRSRVKRYGIIFTCLTTRAVHVDKLDNLSTDSCIMAIDRFSSVRGKPQEIFCDNGTNFRGAERELAKYLEKEEVENKMASRSIKFIFSPPAAPHFGGAWERLVRSIKIAMGSAFKSRVTTDEVLLTTLQQAMFMVNSRPLTEISVDPDNPVVLTPNHFLFGPNYSSVDSSGLKFEDEDLKLRRQWRFAQRLADHFWNKWIKEYLPTLMRRTKWNENRRNAEVGDICVIVDNTTPRDFWKLGRVTAVYPGADGKVRVVDVIVGGSLYKRPVAKVAILDVKKLDD